MNYKTFPPHKRYRILMSLLDDHGVHTHIERVDEKLYNLICNGEIIKIAKKRDTLNKKLIKIYESKT